MKRTLTFFLCLVMLATLCACTAQQQEFREPVSLYYLLIQPADHIHHGSEDSIISPEQREGYQIRDQISVLLETYLKGPATEFYESPFPVGTGLVSAELQGSTLTVTLTDAIAGMTGIELSLACACLSRTCIELWDLESVTIRAETMFLDGKAEITMTGENFLLTDDTISYLDTID